VRSSGVVVDDTALNFSNPGPGGAGGEVGQNGRQAERVDVN
jgi:hypothetical protein